MAASRISNYQSEPAAHLKFEVVVLDQVLDRLVAIHLDRANHHAELQRAGRTSGGLGRLLVAWEDFW